MPQRENQEPHVGCASWPSGRLSGWSRVVRPTMRKVLLFLCVFAVIAIGLGVVLHSILGFFLGIVIVFGGPLGYARFTGRSRKPSKGLYWRGYVSFMETSLTDRKLFPNIVFSRAAAAGVERVLVPEAARSATPASIG